MVVLYSLARSISNAVFSSSISASVIIREGRGGSAGSSKTTCLTCPLNENAPSSNTAVPVCSCNAGYTDANGGVCSGCVTGKYKTTSGSVSCTDCGVGTYSTTVGASKSGVCLTCPVNSNFVVSSSVIAACTGNVGFTGPDGGVCSACIAGNYLH